MRNLKEYLFLAVLFVWVLLFMLGSAGAQTQGAFLKNYLILPPVEYDHEYDGDLTLSIVNTLEELYALCGTRTPFMLACSYINQKSCLVIMVNDGIMRRKGWTTGLLLRHEIGHCNGWSGDHVGQRPVTKDTHWVSEHERARPPLDRLQRAEQVRAGAPAQ